MPLGPPCYPEEVAEVNRVCRHQLQQCADRTDTACPWWCPTDGLTQTALMRDPTPSRWPSARSCKNPNFWGALAENPPFTGDFGLQKFSCKSSFFCNDFCHARSNVMNIGYARLFTVDSTEI